jgi:hypothetical protein
MPVRLTTTTLIATVALAASVHPAAAASECKAPPYDASATDENFSKLVDKNQDVAGFKDHGLYYWDRFGFHEDQGWDRENYGFNDYADPDLPLGRTLNALYLLQHSYTPEATDWNDTSGQAVKSAYPYVAGGLNELDDLRAGGCSEKYAARTQFSILSDNYMIWYH